MNIYTYKYRFHFSIICFDWRVRICTVFDPDFGARPITVPPPPADQEGPRQPGEGASPDPVPHQRRPWSQISNPIGILATVLVIFCATMCTGGMSLGSTIAYISSHC